jgi:hypothetical protein
LQTAIENHIRDVDAFYGPLVMESAGRLSGGERLVAQFAQAVKAYRKNGRSQVSGVIERVNELAVAWQLLLDPALSAAFIEYEPELVPGPKFDFVIRQPGAETLYVEVKTICPQRAITESSWRKPKYETRRVVLDPRASSVAPSAKPCLSPAIEAAFLRYTLGTATKLRTHIAVEPGHGTLIVCSDGLSWDSTNLEVFASIYHCTLLHLGIMIRAQDALLPAVFRPGELRRPAHLGSA